VTTFCSIFPLPGTGEHGARLGECNYLRAELGEGPVELMKTTKRTLDPLGLMNPGKVGPLHFSLLPDCFDDWLYSAAVLEWQRAIKKVLSVVR